MGHSWREKKNRKLRQAAKFNIRKPNKICTKCKFRRKSKYHHYLCDVCWKKHKKEYAERKLKEGVIIQDKDVLGQAKLT